jgi:hypothetical protein
LFAWVNACSACAIKVSALAFATFGCTVCLYAASKAAAAAFAWVNACSACAIKAAALPWAIEDIETGKYNGIISTITEIEYIGVAKRLFSRQRKNRITLTEEQVVMNDFKQFIEKLGVAIANSDDLVRLSGNSKLFCNSKTIIERSYPWFHQQG